MELPVLTSSIDPDGVVAALRQVGAAVVTDVADKAIVDIGGGIKVRDSGDWPRFRGAEHSFPIVGVLLSTSIAGVCTRPCSWRCVRHWRQCFLMLAWSEGMAAGCLPS